MIESLAGEPSPLDRAAVVPAKHESPMLVLYVHPLLTHPSERKTSFQMDPGSSLHFNVTLLISPVMCYTFFSA